VDADRRRDIISAYGQVLENRRLIVGREKDLPFPKDLIRQALAEELLENQEGTLRNALEVGFLELESFLPDQEFELMKAFYEIVRSYGHEHLKRVLEI